MSSFVSDFVSLSKAFSKATLGFTGCVVASAAMVGGPIGAVFLGAATAPVSIPLAVVAGVGTFIASEGLGLGIITALNRAFPRRQTYPINYNAP